jgi:hypothetical protein
MKIAGTRRRLGMADFPGGWTDMIFVETFIKLSFMERIKVLFMGRLITMHYILCEKEPGKTKPTTQIFVGHPLDDKNYKLPKEEITE